MLNLKYSNRYIGFLFFNEVYNHHLQFKVLCDMHHQFGILVKEIYREDFSPTTKNRASETVKVKRALSYEYSIK